MRARPIRFAAAGTRPIAAFTHGALVTRALGPGDDPPTLHRRARDLRHDLLRDGSRDLDERMVVANVDLADLRARDACLGGDHADEIAGPDVVARADGHEQSRERGRPG